LNPAGMLETVAQSYVVFFKSFHDHRSANIMASRSCIKRNSRSALVQGLNPDSVLAMLSESQRMMSGPWASFLGVTLCTHRLNIRAVSGCMCSFINSAISICRRWPRQDLEIQIPLLWVWNYSAKNYRNNWADSATHSVLLGWVRRPQGLDSNVCHRQPWLVLCVVHVQTCQSCVIAIVVQSGLRVCGL
jgi:hypothetical protein